VTDGQRDRHVHSLAAAVNARIGVVLAVGLFVTAAWLRWRALQSSPYPTGVDGYWYLIQVRSLLEEHRLHYPGAPLVPWLMAALAPILGPISAAKAVAAVGSAAIVIPGYLVAKRIANGIGPALVGTALLATSAQSFFLAAEFVKQAVGLSLVMGFAAAFAALLERPGWGRGAGAAALLLACALCHPTALGLAIIVALPPLIARSRRWAGWAVIFAVAAAGTSSPHRFLHLFSARADFSFAVLRTPADVRLALGHEVVWAAILAVAATALSLRKLPALALGFVAFAIFQSLPWINIADDQGLGPRLRLCACIALAPCAALVADRVQQKLRTRDWVPIVMHSLTVAFIVLLRPWTSAEGVVQAHPAMVEATRRVAGAVPSGAIVVVPERHITFMARWYARVDARLRPPQACGDRCYRLMPGAAIRPSLWSALIELRTHPLTGIAPSIDLHPLHPNGLVLLPEATFQYLLANLPPSDRRWYSDWVVR
jgi:hypothetical protein